LQKNSTIYQNKNLRNYQSIFYIGMVIRIETNTFSYRYIYSY